jgi:hypothetical protein
MVANLLPNVVAVPTDLSACLERQRAAFLREGPATLEQRRRLVLVRRGCWDRDACVRESHGLGLSPRAQCSHIAAVHEKSSPPTPRPVTGQKYSYIPPCPMSSRVSPRIRSPQL